MNRARPRVLFLFVDGIGIGRNDPAVNPFFSASCPTLLSWCNGAMLHLGSMARKGIGTAVVPVDASLGIEGLPQSGTGQTALYTGKNAPAIIGKHFGPYVYSELRPLLNEENIFRRVQERGGRPMFANAFPEQYFRYLEHHPSRTTATSFAWKSTGLPFNDHLKLQTGAALSPDVTNERWAQLGYPAMPVISPVEAGKRLAVLLAENDFVLYEYYSTDKAGHRQDPVQARASLEVLDGLLAGVMAHLDFSSTTLVMTSDHGNLEDLSTKSHTRNPVPLLLKGPAAEQISAEARALTDIAPAILRLFA